jgi:hypothetical protein
LEEIIAWLSHGFNAPSLSVPLPGVHRVQRSKPADATARLINPQVNLVRLCFQKLNIIRRSRLAHVRNPACRNRESALPTPVQSANA